MQACLLPDDHPLVEQELLRRTATGQGDPDMGFVEEHSSLYRGLHLSWGVPSPHPATTRSPWLATLTPCQKSFLILRQHQLLAGTRKVGPTPPERCPLLIVDLNPSPDRNRNSKPHEHGSGHLAPCMLPKQLLWTHKPEGHERLFLGWESMLVQGFPVGRVPYAEEVPDGFLQDLGGNMMTTLVALAVVQEAGTADAKDLVAFLTENLDQVASYSDSLQLIVLELAEELRLRVFVRRQQVERPRDCRCRQRREGRRRRAS